MAVIEVEGVDTVYEGEKYPSIRGIDLEIEEGDFVCVMGPNGAGKTTLLETINGLLNPSSGTVRTLGKEISNDGTGVRKRVGYLVQNFSFDPSTPFLVKDVVLMGRYGKLGLLKFPQEKDRSIARECMEFTGVADFAEEPIGKLSGGEQQKVLLARVLAQRPEILLLDEPLTNLDITAKEEIRNLIERIHEEKGVTVVMVTHDLGSVPDRASNIVLMDQGNVVAKGKPEEIVDSEAWKSAYGKGVISN